MLFKVIQIKRISSCSWNLKLKEKKKTSSSYNLMNAWRKVIYISWYLKQREERNYKNEWNCSNFNGLSANSSSKLCCWRRSQKFVVRKLRSFKFDSERNESAAGEAASVWYHHWNWRKELSGENSDKFLPLIPCINENSLFTGPPSHSCVVQWIFSSDFHEFHERIPRK